MQNILNTRLLYVWEKKTLQSGKVFSLRFIYESTKSVYKIKERYLKKNEKMADYTMASFPSPSYKNI